MIIALLVLIAVLLGVVSYQLRRHLSLYRSQSPTIQLEAATRAFTRGAEQHMAVHGIMALTSEMANKPELAVNLAQYGRDSIATTLLYRINSASASIKELTDEIKQMRSLEVQTPDLMEFEIRQALLKIDELQAEMAAAYEAIQTMTGLPAQSE